MRSYLISGGAGFIGSHLAKILSRSGHRVTLVDNLFSGSLKNIISLKGSNNFSFYKEDVTNFNRLASICKRVRPEVFINCATSGSLRSLIFPEWCYLQEIKIVRTACQLAREKYFKRLIYLSTAEVYGRAENYPVDENTPLNPISPHAAAKVASEVLIQSYVNLYDIDAIIFRLFNVFGPNQSSYPYPAIIPSIVDKITTGSSVEIFGKGDQTRDFFYVEDVAKIIIRFSMIKKVQLKYLICSGREMPILDLLEFMKEVFKEFKINNKINILFKKERISEVHRSFGRCNWDFPDFKKTNFNLALKKTLSYYLKEV